MSVSLHPNSLLKNKMSHFTLGTTTLEEKTKKHF